METMDILDVTVIEPRFKHPTIFQKFDDLEKGGSFVIHNDHDPKPLYYQLLAERGSVFTWQYLEDGPKWWKVQIGKLKNGESEASIGDLVSKDFRKAEVFKKFGLDYCCGGKKTLTQACREKGLDVVQIEKELKAAETTSLASSHDYNNWELGFLAEYILNTHHKYVVQATPVITEYTQKVAQVHGGTHPEVIEIAKNFQIITDELVSHMAKEEIMLFPYIKELAAAKMKGTAMDSPGFGTIENPVRMMEMEHVAVGDVMETVSRLTNKYTSPVDACTTYRLAYAKLKEFEDDLHQHIHLESNILFPKAVALEKELLGRN